MATPTLIDMPEPPSNPDTPTEAPGTPNSATTSISALSTIAIKDGHRGASFPHSGHGHHHSSSSNTLEAERADRISRLAGLERVSTVRPSNPNFAGSPAAGPGNAGQIPGYFDAAGNPVYTTKMSTVGSASATGSTGGRTTTWASGSAKEQTEGDEDEREADQMSMDTNYREMDERDRYSQSAMDEDMDQDGMSDDTSLVGFGEGAGSTVSGPTYSRLNLQRSGLANQLGSNPTTPLSERTTATADQQRREARMIDGLADDAPGYVDTAARGGPVPAGARGTGLEAILRERLDDGEQRRPLGSPDEAGLGKFYFEEKK